jgi:mycothiol synthase
MREGNLPEGYTARALAREDLPAVLEMTTAASLADEGRVRHTMHELEASFDTDGFEPTTDTSMVLDRRGACAGLAEVYDLDAGHLQPRAYLQIAPAHRSSGIHGHLLAFLDRRLREVAERAASEARVEALTVLHPKDSPILGWLHDAGWQSTRHVWEMAIDLPDEPAAPSIPDGFVIRAGVAERDEESVHRASEEAFADHFGFVPTSFDMWLALVVTYSESTPDLWLIAEPANNPAENGEVAGMALTSLRYQQDALAGYVNTLGVRRPYRRHGLGETLLRSAFLHLYARGMRKVILHVDSESLTGATRLYERAGMHVVAVMTQCGMELRPATTQP